MAQLLLSLPLSDYEEFVAEVCGVDEMAAVQNRGPSPQSPSKRLTVVDVYDLSASIGKDFEKLIDQHGSSCVRNIMPKVISALETLEAFAANNEQDNEELIRLQQTIDQLEDEKRRRVAQHKKIEEEMESIEETYRKDISELRLKVKALTTENQTLSSTVSSMPIAIESPNSAYSEENIRQMLELKEESLRQKEEIKALQRDVDQYVCEVENLQNSVEKLIRQNEELLRKNHSLQKQGRMIVEEKIDIIKRLERTEEMNIQLRAALTDSDRICKDLQQVNALDDEPRFTLSELREVLQEKNVLKGRVMELEEELDNLRPGGGKKELEKLEDTPPPEEALSSAKEEDLPVYGPLPREPDEKLYPWKYERKDSGVRKFFRFFKDLGASPRRGSSANNSPRPSRAATMQTLSGL